MELAPVVLFAGSKGMTVLLVSASAVSGIVGSLGYSAADVLFAGAYGVLVDDALLEVVSVTEQEAGGVPYMYRLTLREPLTLGI